MCRSRPTGNVPPRFLTGLGKSWRQSACRPCPVFFSGADQSDLSSISGMHSRCSSPPTGAKQLRRFGHSLSAHVLCWQEVHPVEAAHQHLYTLACGSILWGRPSVLARAVAQMVALKLERRRDEQARVKEAEKKAKAPACPTALSGCRRADAKV